MIFYNKNNNISLDGPMSMDDYKELFINYKLKAFDATKKFPDLKLNSYISEIESYTKHLAYPYLITGPSRTPTPRHHCQPKYRQKKNPYQK